MALELCWKSRSRLAFNTRMLEAVSGTAQEEGPAFQERSRHGH